MAATPSAGAPGRRRGGPNQTPCQSWFLSVTASNDCRFLESVGPRAARGGTWRETVHNIQPRAPKNYAGNAGPIAYWLGAGSGPSSAPLLGAPSRTGPT